MFPATLFDYNGVLVDDEHVHFAAFRDTLAPRGIELGEDRYWQRYLGFDDAGAFRAILQDCGFSPTDAEIRGLIAEKKPRYAERASRSLTGFPGAAELVRRRAGVGPVVIVSGALRDEIELGLEVLGIRDVVQAIVSAEDAERSKPDPQGYLMGMDLLRRELTAEEVAMAMVVEDSIAGVQAAKAAGLACVAVTHSYPETALRDAGADLVAQGLPAITDAALRDLFLRLSVE